MRNNLPLSDIVPPTIQERAWSSPIWYTPANTDVHKWPDVGHWPSIEVPERLAKVILDRY